MNHALPVIALPLTAVEIDGMVGNLGYLEALPSVHHVDLRPDGGLVVWLDETPEVGADLVEHRPERPPEIELHGPGRPRQALIDHPRAEHVEMFFDGLGDPEAAPLGWWHARVWLRVAA